MWGWAGPVGEGTTDGFKPALVPKPLPAHLRGTVDIAELAFALSDGGVVAWGSNSFGTLGTGGDTGQYSTAGIRLKVPTGVVRVWSSHNRVIAMKSDGTLYLWGPGLGRANARTPVIIGKCPDIIEATL